MNRPGARQQNKQRYEYIPPQTSGAYAILVSMYQAASNEFITILTRQQILDYCKKYAPTTSKDNSKTWAQMQSLVNRRLISRFIDRETKYQMTEDGKDLAQKLLALAQARLEGTNGQEPVPLASSQSSTLINGQTGVTCLEGGLNFVLQAGTFDIVLVVDSREHTNVSMPDNSIIIDNRTLACGDYMWVARPKGLTMYDKTKDLVLDYVIERKRLDDLIKSMYDGRFDQQKMRLLGTGVRRPLFMIEQYGIPTTARITLNDLAQKAAHILVIDKIEVQKVKNASFANDYLVGMTKSLTKLLSNKDLRSCSQDKMKRGEADKCEFMTFSEFQSKGAKITNWTVRDMFAKHLVQIQGLSDKRVSVIIKQYPTVPALMDAYARCGSEKERENMLAKLKLPDSNRTLGPMLSKRVCATYAMPADWLQEHD